MFEKMTDDELTKELFKLMEEKHKAATKQYLNSMQISILESEIEDLNDSIENLEEENDTIDNTSKDREARLQEIIKEIGNRANALEMETERAS